MIVHVKKKYYFNKVTINKDQLKFVYIISDYVDTYKNQCQCSNF